MLGGISTGTVTVHNLPALDVASTLVADGLIVIAASDDHGSVLGSRTTVVVTKQHNEYFSIIEYQLTAIFQQ